MRPFAFANTSATSMATKSTTFSFTASRSVADTLLRTAFSAHSTLRPRCWAIVRDSDAAKFSTFSPIVPSMLPP